ncbi:uncharacterized protein I206_105817 [Kwoniella pini CBS 10737]|uniref:PARP-type domain-containing protein n=1 Tax=Kwoniella pini CBS 10737 TaxID=1296096 RepID=A0A1B9I091_9TREE|nr:uncharacterized protein I206_04637 [Kwoniella pini CBS 10737]OCF48950.1 hypothetical protein I206_04637 [Kwoniella pini CBS 10737]
MGGFGSSTVGSDAGNGETISNSIPWQYIIPAIVPGLLILLFICLRCGLPRLKKRIFARVCAKPDCKFGRYIEQKDRTKAKQDKTNGGLDTWYHKECFKENENV